jgi:hypothetical protein
MYTIQELENYSIAITEKMDTDELIELNVSIKLKTGFNKEQILALLESITSNDNDFFHGNPVFHAMSYGNPSAGLNSPKINSDIIMEKSGSGKAVIRGRKGWWNL